MQTLSRTEDALQSDEDNSENKSVDPHKYFTQIDRQESEFKAKEKEILENLKYL